MITQDIINQYENDPRFEEFKLLMLTYCDFTDSEIVEMYQAEYNIEHYAEP